MNIWSSLLKSVRVVGFFVPTVSSFVWKQSKSTWGEQPFEDIPNFTCICVYLFIYVFVSRLHGQMKNDTDLKFGTHPPLDYLKFFFWKGALKGRYLWKTAVSSGFYANLLNFIVMERVYVGVFLPKYFLWTWPR